MAKRSHPALYEVIRSKGPLVAPKSAEREPPTPAPAPARVDSAGSSGSGLPGLLTPGQMVRLPVGYVWISIAAVVTAVVLAYVVGHAAGRSLVERERDRELASAITAAEEGLEGAAGQGAAAGVARDPLRSGGSERVAQSGQAGTPLTDRGTGRSGAEVTTDPRIAGHHYYVLAHGTEEGAPRMATFLREQGLDAWVVPDHNGRLRKVIAMPGLADRTEQTTPAAVALRASIEEGLRKWRQATGDRTRRSPDYYLEQHGPPASR